MNEGRIKVKTLSIFFIWILVCAVFAVFVNISEETAGADIWIVDQAGGGNFTTIQDAINNSNDGDTIYVWAGTYVGNVVVNRTLTLIGNGTSETIIDGGASGHAVTVQSDWVNITGFTVTNAGSGGNIAGVYVDTVGNCTFDNNNLSGNPELGIFLWASSDCTISGNELMNNGVPLFLWAGSQRLAILFNNMSGNYWGGIQMGTSAGHTISGNNIGPNTNEGCWLINVRDSTISHNNIFSNGYGMRLESCDGNMIFDNNITANTDRGIDLNSGCNDNTISGNDITSNTNYGIYIYGADNNNITENYISDNDIGIYFTTQALGNTISGNNITSNVANGLVLISSDGNTIFGNNITSNDVNGIDFLSSSGNTISGNNITSNDVNGIDFDSSDGNTIFDNNIISNTNYGLYLTGSDSNEIYHNNIIDNTNQAFDDGTNFWNLPYPGGGNYWNDYTGKDIFSGVNQDILGSDGFGDTPYDIAGGGGERDYYPLTRPLGTPSVGEIFITSHKDGEYVGGTIVIEAVVTFADISGVNFYVNGMPMFFDDSYSYQFVLDTTTLPEDAGFDLRAEAVLFYGYPVPTSITLYVNNIVDTGSYISVSTLNSEYQPDEDVSVLVSMVSPPAFESLELEVNCIDPSGHPMYTSVHLFPYGSEFRVIMSLPSDAELGTYSVTVDAYGFVDDSMVWNATDSTTFLVSGMSLRDQLEELNQTLTGLNLTELIATLDQLNQTLSDLDLTELLDAIDYLNQTLPVKIDDLSLQLSGVNDSLQSGISSAEINLLNELAGVNATLSNDIQNLLTSITSDIIGMNSSLEDQLTNLLNTMTTDSDALRTWLDIVLGAIDTNLTDTRAVLETQLGDLEDYMAGFNDSLQSDLDGIIADIQAHDSNTGQNHSNIINMLSIVQGDIGELDIDDLKTMLTSLGDNVSTFDQSIAADIQKVVDDISEFENGAGQRLDNISNTLDDLARWEDVLSKLEELDSDLDTAEDELSASIDKIPTEKEEGFGVTEGLLIVVLILLILILLVMLTGRGRQVSGPEEISKERVEPKTMDLEEEEEWKGEEEPEEEESEEVEEIEFEE